MKMKWISVKDALPEESMEVIVHVEFMDMKYVSTVYFNKEIQRFMVVDKDPKFWKIDNEKIKITYYGENIVTHWMPLPSFNLKEPSTKIVPLEWQEEGDEGFIAFGSFGTFEVMKSGNRLLPWLGSLNDANGYDGYEEMEVPTIEEARSYCNELHEKMIREALEFVEVDA